MADARTTKILETALWRFALQGVHATTTAEVARLAGVGTLFCCFASKEKLLQATFEFAIAQLVAPLPEGVGRPSVGSTCTSYSSAGGSSRRRLTYAEAFLRRLVRTTPRVTLSAEPLRGPFAGVVTLMDEAPWPVAPSTRRRACRRACS
jgi:AcrR family transcriptional regulator